MLLLFPLVKGCCKYKEKEPGAIRFEKHLPSVILQNIRNCQIQGILQLGFWMQGIYFLDIHLWLLRIPKVKFNISLKVWQSVRKDRTVIRHLLQYILFSEDF